MQPEPTAVSQHTPPVDSSQANPRAIQHGHDFDDIQVPSLLAREGTGGSANALDQTQGEYSLLNEVTHNSLVPSPSDHRISQHENGGTPTNKRKGAGLEFRVAVFTSQSQASLEAFPNEVLTHILSHLPPQSLSVITLVSRRFHTLVTTPHAWRIAFSRFFPGPHTVESANRPEADLTSDRRFFTRLTALASWRSEYILRTRLIRSLSRGKPADFQPSKKHGTVRSTNSRNGSAVSTYTSQLLYPVSHIHGSFGTGSEKEPLFIHGASEQGISSASVPSAVKVGTWGLSDHQMFRHFADLFPGDSPFGLGPGNIVGVPNSMDVSQPYGMIYGEGCPQGRSYFISTTEQRGRFLGGSDLGSHPHLGIPALNMITHSICSVWIAKSFPILQMTGGLMGMLSGSSSGVLTAYALGPHPTYEKRYERGQVTARWVLSPGVPIIGICVDDNYSPKRQGQGRIWAVALNALGEVFYLTGLPRQPDVACTAKLNAEQLDELAWKTGRSVRWELAEMSRREARPDPFSRDPVDGSYSPRSSSDSMGLDQHQVTAETKEIERFLSFKPKHFRKVCEGWDMRRDLQADFASDDGQGAGESVIIVARGANEDTKPSVRRFVRIACKSDLSSPGMPELCPRSVNEKIPTSIFGGPMSPSSPAGSNSPPPSRSSSRLIDPVSPSNTEWRISEFVFGDRKPGEITTSGLDVSTLALLTAEEDPLLAMSASSFSSAGSSPMMPHMEQPRSNFEIPGQRARYLAVGTITGMIFIWDIRAPAAQTTDVINSVPPLRVIQTDSPQVSCVALTSLYLVHGGNDGLVQAWDPLASSTRPIRTINSRFSSRARRRLVQAEASMLGVGNNYYATGAICLDPDSTVLRGMVSLGTHLRYWSYSSSSADQYKSGKRRLRRLQRGSNGASEGQRFNTSGRGAIQDYIEDERVEMERQKIADEKDRAHLNARFGVDLLGPDIDEDQLLAYAQLLSEESYTGDASKRGDSAATASSVASTSPSDIAGPSSYGVGEGSSSCSPYLDPADENTDDDMAEAIRLSLLDDKPAAPPIDRTPSIPIKYAKGLQPPSTSSPAAGGAESSRQTEMDDLEFAIQLSLAENQGHDNISQQEWEEFPVVAPGPLSSQSSGKGKGKARAV
ncbi:hypothetical protein NUU61_004630 [Penicillium alfredii]|uniref:F-box domain-containing protein n=1 Tax=Penicillium alfredii TaxID=1506179 RepID=A0A9W9FLL3_9EURO|nr:uncharacterized protein NUU61_004630 [Penicillium alfredii]KAJ5102408.1 hypothetical protein NUU61_004630 [Penicillium alfredii]